MELIDKIQEMLTGKKDNLKTALEKINALQKQLQALNSEALRIDGAINSLQELHDTLHK